MTGIGVGSAQTAQSIDEHAEWNGIDWKKNEKKKKKKVATPWTHRNHATYAQWNGRNLQVAHARHQCETEICCSPCVAVSRSFHNSLIYVFSCLPFNSIFVERVLIGESQPPPTKGHSRIETLTVFGLLFSFFQKSWQFIISASPVIVCLKL